MERKMKTCSRCGEDKHVIEFYSYHGKVRPECKKCTIERNRIYQKSVPRASRYIGDEEQRAYYRAYYESHKEKFAEYRRTFKERHPEYHQHRRQKGKNMRFRKDPNRSHMDSE
jgi:hypothetical protein